MTTLPKTQKPSSWAPFGRTPSQQPKTFRQSTLLQWAVSILLLLLVWQLISVTQIVPSKALPGPAAILTEIQRQPEFFTLAYIPRRGNFFNLPTSILVSLQRVLLGLASAFVASLLVGLLISYIPLIRRLVLPIVQLMAPISPIAWMPVIAVFFGVSETAIVAVIFIALFFVLTLSTIESIENVPKVYLDTSRVLGATSRWQVMAYVVLPAIVPDLFLTLRLNFFAAWLSLLVAEFIGAKTGLGQMVIAGRGVFNMSLVILAMIVIGVCGMLCEALLRTIQNRILWWRRQIEL
jgi:NitT/TauT family transport system permease protein